MHTVIACGFFAASPPNAWPRCRPPSADRIPCITATSFTIWCSLKKTLPSRLSWTCWPSAFKTRTSECKSSPSRHSGPPAFPQREILLSCRNIRFVGKLSQCRRPQGSDPFFHKLHDFRTQTAEVHACSLRGSQSVLRGYARERKQGAAFCGTALIEAV